MRRPLERAASMSPARLTPPGRGCGTENLASSSNGRSSGTTGGARGESTVTAASSPAAEPGAHLAGVSAGVAPSATARHYESQPHDGLHMSVSAVIAVDPRLHNLRQDLMGRNGRQSPA